MRRFLLTAIAVFAFGAHSAAAADVTVNFARDGGSKTVELGSLSGSFDVSNEYVLIAAGGQTTTKQINGISLRALLDAVGADPVYSAVTIARPGGGVVRISRVQIEASGISPVVYTDGGLATFVRPAYSAGDRNAEDVISGSPLVITQVDEIKYDVKAKTSRSKAKVGQTVRFSASASGAAGQKLIYSWRFDDGRTASGAEVAHKFSKRGYYRVLVSVRGEGESESKSEYAVIRVQVGKAQASKKSREGGGTNDAAAAPISGAADGGQGDGEVAGGERPKQRSSKKTAEPAESDLPVVSGELLTATKTQQPQSALGARTGQQARPASPTGASIPNEAAGAAVALSLLGLGAALELGGAHRLRRRLLA